jgi:ribosome-binding protein aMBF1 (putative translation factor)
MIALFYPINSSLHTLSPIPLMNSNEKLLKNFSNHLRKLREKKGLTNAEMARRCLMDRSNYSRYESGTANPSLSTLKLFAEAMEISLEELFLGFK